MPITGGIKLFGKNLALEVDGSSASASSGNAAANRVLDKNRFTFWRSDGSNDLTTETLTITFPSSTTLTRILLIDHNFKQFQIKYDNGSSFVDFTNVIGLDGSLGSISETTFSDDTAYYEFDSVSTLRVQITIDTTQTTDAQKFLNQFIATTELGTLEGFPRVDRVRLSRSQRRARALSGKSLIQKSDESHQIRLTYRSYPASLENDITLFTETIFDREQEFLVWLSGGRRGSDFFKHQLRGFRLKDVFPMQLSRDISVGYNKNYYKGVVNFSLDLVEVI